MLKSWKFPGWKLPHQDILTECRKLLRSTMYSMGKVLRRKSPNLVENSKVEQIVDVVEAVEAQEIIPSPVERVRKFHY